MKKMMTVFTVVVISSMNNGFYGSQLIQKEYNKEYASPSFLDAADSVQDEYGTTDEYGYIEGSEYQENNQSVINEYDQHICDGVKPPKISSAEALIKDMFGFMLVQYITIKEFAHAYCREIKDALSKWLSMLLIKA